MNDTDYMRLALELAERGRGWTNPNPMVGAVIVKDGRVIGEGYHHRCGALHAEREAFAACRESPAGATLYVTLEPCCHHGRQPPCTEAILEAGISRVVVGSGDPNPLVAGKGLDILRAHGAEVETGVLQPECDALNAVFFHYIRTRQPYVVMKYAMTLDGKIATRTGASRWITGEKARERVHQDRRRYAAIMAGVGTVLADDPLLTCRMEGGRNPVRVICDTHLRTPSPCPSTMWTPPPASPPRSGATPAASAWIRLPNRKTCGVPAMCSHWWRGGAVCSAATGTPRPRWICAVWRGSIRADCAARSCGTTAP